MSNISQYNETTGVMGGARPNEVTCVDGTKDISNGKMPPCTNNGGVKEENQPIVNVPQKEVAYSSVNLSPEEKFYDTLGIKQYDNSPLRGFPVKLKGRLLVAVVLVGGYLAYKKFKK